MNHPPSPSSRRLPMWLTAVGIAVVAASLLGLVHLCVTESGLTKEAYGGSSSQLSLRSGTYWIYEDPGDGPYNTPGDTPSAFHVVGPNGSFVAVAAHDDSLSINDLGGFIVGTGSFSPVASFDATQSGRYSVRLDPQFNHLYVEVGPTQPSALARSLVWIVGLALGSALLIVSAAIGRRRRIAATHDGAEPDDIQ
jgi:hypothetical protein